MGHLRKAYEHIVQPEQAVVCSHSIDYRYPLFLLNGFFSCVQAVISAVRPFPNITVNAEEGWLSAGFKRKTS